MTYKREEITELFCMIANTAEPDHSYQDNPYPITVDNVKETWKQSRSNYHSSCGPRNTISYSAKFAVDLDYANSVSNERLLTLIIHEVTHLEEGYHTPGSSHNPAFWNAMAKNAVKVIENIYEFETGFFGENINVSELKEELVNDINSCMVDKRMETVAERKEKMRKELSGV